jgi:hypothetical protein
MNTGAGSVSNSPNNGRRNVRTREFRRLWENLDPETQELAGKAFAIFRDNPNHPGLHNKSLNPNSRGAHPQGSHSVRISARYRAIYFVDGDVNVWCWIGSHSDYNRFTGVSG